MNRTNSIPEAAQPVQPERELPASKESITESTLPPSTEDAASLETIKAERDSLRERAARMQAEFENARKRVSREQQEFRTLALSDALRALLPVLDSLDRALATPVPNLQEFRGGVELIQKQLHDTLTQLGLRPISARGEPFDPVLHEAVDMVETTDVEDNYVVDELQRGYKYQHRLLRPTMVRVARNSQSTNRGQGGS